MELVCKVENIDQLNLIEVQDTLRDLAQKPRFVA